jgi:predicted TIM-barrel fold metal-dependent hydrolase
VQDQGSAYAIVSSDCHAGANVLGYRAYLESRWHDDFDAWAATYRDPWLAFEQAVDDRTADREADGRTRRAGAVNGIIPTNWDSQVRLNELESDGIVGEVLFPNTAPPFFPSGTLTAATPRTRDEYEHRWAGLKAHNRWLVDFCAQVPGRRAGIAQILLNDVDDAAQEIHWVREAGLRGGVLLPMVEPSAPIPPVFSNAYERVWATCADLDVPINQHSTAGGMYEERYLTSAAGSAIVWTESAWFSSRTLWHMIYGGIFERHPQLRFVITEQGVDWIPQRLLELDFACKSSRSPGTSAHFFIGRAERQLSMLPSEYFARNCWVGATVLSRYDVDIGVLNAIGDRLMWGSDYPHAEGSFPDSRHALKEAIYDRGEDEVRSLLGGRAIDVYGLDREALQTAADRVGPRPSDLAA